MVTSLRPKPGPPRSYHFPDFHDQMLPSGIRLVLAPVAKLPVVTILVVIDAGSTNDPEGREGVAALTAGTLLEGSERFDGAELAEKFEQLGTSVESGADWDGAFIKITVLSDQLEEATKLLGEAISSPVFPEREVERAKAERLAEILQLETEPRGLADEKFSEFLYTPESRYSKPDEGNTESVSALSRKDVLEFYKSRYRAGSTTVIIAGDVSTDEARALIARALDTWGRLDIVINNAGFGRPRMVFNLSDEESALVFLNLAATPTAQSDYPVIRIALQPGEGFWLPRIPIAHDGDTRGRTEVDVQLVLRGE